MSKVVAIIPARKGSKRLPNKNKRMFAGKPLICWTVEVALECEFIDQIIVSTDDIDIIKICKEQYIDAGRSGLKLMAIKRPEELAYDDTPMWQVVNHALKEYPLETTVILLQPTSPLRTLYDISMAYEIFRERLRCTLISVFREDFYRFKLNGSIYIFSIGNLLLTGNITKGEFMGIYLMSEEKSIDIDTIEDFKKAEKIMLKRLKSGS